MVLALKEISIRGEFRNTVEYLIKLLETSTFRECLQTTAWLDDLIKSGFGREKQSNSLVVAAGATWHAVKIFKSRALEAKKLIGKGQRPTGDSLSRTTQLHFIFNQVQYQLTAKLSGPDRLVILMNESEISIKFVSLPDGGLLTSMFGSKSFLLYGREEAQGLLLSINGHSMMIEKEYNPTIVRSPSPGKLVRYLVEDGTKVPAGTAIAELEVMKMYMPLTVSEAGSVALTKMPGCSLEAGETVAHLKLLDPRSVQLSPINQLGFEDIGPAIWEGQLLHQRFSENLCKLSLAIIDGYEGGRIDPKTVLNQMMDPLLPIGLCEEALSNITSRLPIAITTELFSLLDSSKSSGQDVISFLETAQRILTEYGKECDSRDLPLINNVLEIVKLHIGGPKAFTEHVLGTVCNQFYQNAIYFDEAYTSDGILYNMKQQGLDDQTCFNLFSAWHSGESRQLILGKLLNTALEMFPGDFDSGSFLMQSIRKLSKLTSKDHARISQAASQALVNATLPRLSELRQFTEKKLLSFDPKKHDSFVIEMVSGMAYHVDVIPLFFLHENAQTRLLALEIYIRRVFEAFNFLETTTIDDDTFMWTVAAPPPSKKEEFSSPAPTSSEPFERRAGAFAAFSTEDAAQKNLSKLISRLSPAEATKNVVYFSVPDGQVSDDQVLADWVPWIQSHAEGLREHQIKRVTMVRIRENSTSMGFFTFRDILNWKEDCQVRHMEPAMSYLLELPRMLENYNIKLCHADPSGQIHIYKGDSIDGKSPSRLFIRVLVRPMQTMRGHNTLMSLISDAKGIFDDVLDAVAMVQSNQGKPLDCNHIYINVLPTFYAHPQAAADMFLALMGASEDKLLKLRMMQGEIRMQLAKKRGEMAERYRFILWNETGFIKRVAIYQEVRESETHKPVLTALNVQGVDEYQDTLATAPHAPLSRLQVKRNRVHALGTSYIYDFPAIFEKAVQNMWSSMGSTVPEQGCLFTELILDKDVLREVNRDPGQNTIGMVAWRAILKTPAHPLGRTIIVIGNDIDFEIGSFGVEEDRLFAAASTLARENRWPRVFLSANSGARIGLAEELRNIIKAKWNDLDNLNLGFEYLYLDEADYDKVNGSVKAEYVPELKHYRITDVLTGLGVENLSGSGLIASETSRAYEETFTLTFVTGRSVGIGAYLVRLGQRVIQKHTQPIILTGVQALNQLLGRDVYTSNLQIGGPQIMALNGVAHLVVANDLEGVERAIEWIDFVPVRSEDKPLRPIEATCCKDDPNRLVGYTPPADSPYDPRLLISGAKLEDERQLDGLLDRGSFVECQSAWARSVVVGRGRLGGLPVAVLLVETRTTEASIPADPATPSSESTVIPQAGQVWYPDSAYKTAQFLRDCNYGERLPLLILANWRGFSGGQRDLFDEILKFGSYIVDALREYTSPVFVYLPPGGQLRGGSWVVVDTAINPRSIEMYADPSARGGILESEGLVAIKFRGPQLRSMMTRLIPDSTNWPKEQQDRMITTMHQIACHFADLHDRPGRMKVLGVIKGIVKWKESRTFFYHRLRVRLWLLQLVDRGSFLCKHQTREQIGEEIEKALMFDWLPTLCIDTNAASDKEIADAMNKHASKLEELLQEWSHSKLYEHVRMLMERLAPGERAALAHTKDL